MGDTSQPAPAPVRRTLLGRIARGLRRCGQVVLLLLALYLLIALVGLIPVNNDFQPTPDGVEIMVISSGVHADFVLPVRNEAVDWRQHLPPGDFAGDVSGATLVSFGWGNKEFYMNTPTWADLKAKTALRALFWPSETCMHVFLWDEGTVPINARKTRLSPEQYRRLVEYIRGSFHRDRDGRFLCVKGLGRRPNDAFYDAHGTYHAFDTCNCWVGRGLKASGVRTGWFTPLPRTVGLYIPAPRE